MEKVFEAWQKKEAALKAYWKSFHTETTKMTEQEKFEHEYKHAILNHEKNKTDQDFYRASLEHNKENSDL